MKREAKTEKSPQQSRLDCSRNIQKQAQFTHKVNSVLQLKDQKSGIAPCKDMELVLDEKNNTYYLRHVKGKPQMSIYDMDKYRRNKT